MVFSFMLNEGKEFSDLQSFGNEFQTIAPRYAKLFCSHFVFNRGGLRFELELRSVLFATEDMLLRRLERYGGTWPFLGL